MRWVVVLLLACLFGLASCAEDVVDDLERPPHRDIDDGTTAAVGSGLTFLARHLAIAEADRGFTFPGSCRGANDCTANALSTFGPLSNDQIRQGLLGGETLLLVEVTGIDEPFYGDDEAVSVRIYGGRDADEPFFPANNFHLPEGLTTCCELLVTPSSLRPDGTPRVQLRGRIAGGVLTVDAADVDFTLSVGAPPHPELRFRHFQLSVLLGTRDAEEVSPYRRTIEGLLGGVWPANNLAQLDNPYCKTLNNLCPQMQPASTLLDLLASFIAVDIDVDRDGLESLVMGAVGLVEECRDGDGRLVSAPAAETSCALDPAIQDGYSFAAEIEAIEAKIVGVAD